MSDLRDAYLEWLLNGRQGPRPGTPKAPAEPAGPEQIPLERSLVPRGPTDLVPPPAVAIPAAGIWSRMAGPAAMGAGAATLMHLANPPEAGTGEDDLMNALLSKEPQTVRISSTPADEFKGIPNASVMPASAPKSAGSAMSPAMKKSLQNLANEPDDMDARVNARMRQRQMINQEASPSNLDELRMMIRLRERERIKQEMNRGKK